MISVSSNEHGGLSVSSTHVVAGGAGAGEGGGAAGEGGGTGGAGGREEIPQRQQEQEQQQQERAKAKQKPDLIRLFTSNDESNVHNGETLLESREEPPSLLRRTQRSFAKLCRSLDKFAGKRFSSTQLRSKEVCPCSVAGRLIVSIAFNSWLALQLEDNVGTVTTATTMTTTRYQHVNTLQAASLALVHAARTFAATRADAKAPMMSIAACVLLVKDLIAVDHALCKVAGVCDPEKVGHSFAATTVAAIRKETAHTLAKTLEQLSGCVSVATQNCCATVFSPETERFTALVPTSFGETTQALDRDWARGRGKKEAPAAPPLDKIGSGSHLLVAKRVLEDVLWVGLDGVLQNGAAVPAQASRVVNTCANAAVLGILTFVASSGFRVNSGGASILDRNFALIEAAARERSRTGWKGADGADVPLPALETWRKGVRPVIEAAPPESCLESCLPLSVFGVGGRGGDQSGGNGARVAPIGGGREEDAAWVARFELLRTSKGN